MSKIYVGNLSFSTTDADLTTLFAKHGAVTSVSIINDKYTNRSRGFAFVEMETEEAAQKAIAECNGVQLDGRAIVVNAAKPQEPRRERSFGGNRERSSGSGSSRPRRW